MNRIDWGYYKRHIPNKVQVAPKVFYEVFWTDEFVASDNLGETRYSERQIIIKKKMSNKLTVVTYIHELVHAMSYEHGMNLTEAQVLSSESFFMYLLKDGNIFKAKGKKKNE